MEKTTLIDQMEKYYVDADGSTIKEAVELGHAILQFYSDIHSCVGLALKQNEDGLVNKVCDFYISLVMENFTRDAVSFNESNLKSQVETFKAENTEVGLKMHEILLGSYSEILDNSFFQHPTCNIIIRSSVIEGVVRTCNAHVFCLSPEMNGPQRQHNHVLMCYSNMHCSYHCLAWIAFLCNADMEAYYNMNIEVEMYANEICSAMADLISAAASGY